MRFRHLLAAVVWPLVARHTPRPVVRAQLTGRLEWKPPPARVSKGSGGGGPMGARRCDACSLNFPNEQRLFRCPVCGGETAVRLAETPMSRTELRAVDPRTAAEPPGPWEAEVQALRRDIAQLHERAVARNVSWVDLLEMGG